jgi:membrane associated rhomboid family serine protease
MGIYDREYYRREGPSFLGSLTERGKACNWLLGLNILFFIIQLVTLKRGQDGTVVGNGSFTDWLVLIPEDVLHGQVWRLLSYAFLHEASFGTLPWHIIFNMLFLWWFGRQVEDMLGTREFVLFYLAAAVLSGLTYFACALAGIHPMNAHVLGASGAVMAVLVLAACYNPRQIIYLFFFLPVPIWGFVVFSVVMDGLQFLHEAAGNTAGRVAVSAHLGGAAFGFLYFKFGWRLAGLLRLPRRSRPRLRLYREDDVGFVPAGKPTPPPAAPRLDDEHLEAQVDAILAKIPRVGMEGLTDQERQVLLRASEAIKRRRG